MRLPDTERRRPSLRGRAWLIAVAVALLVLVLSLRQLATFYTDYLWFDSVGFGDTWRGLLSARAVPAVVFTVAFFAVLYANLVIADRLAPKFRSMGPEDELLERYQQFAGPYQGRIRVGVAAFFALVAGTGVSSQWREWILFRNRVDFGVEDPQFGKDVGFYVFELPFLRFVADWAFFSLLIVLLVTAVAHYLNGGIRFQSPFQRVTPQVKAHLSVILGAMALAKTAQYYLGQYNLALSSRGVVDGAGATDVNAQLPALRLLIFISIAAAVLFLVNIRRRGWVLPVIAVGLWAFVSLVVGTIYPALYQRFRVDPNELESERRFIERNVAATRDAFDLADVEVKRFDYAEDLTPEDVVANAATIDNARLWDPGEILRNYRSLQQLGTFYRFAEADIDRYEVDGEVRQVLLAARELNRDDLPSQSWVNRHLVYTHGFGAVVSPANAADRDGFPEYLLSDIPPQGELSLERPQVYFGEELGGYALVGAGQDEFDFPREDKTSAFTRYDGEGGVGMSGWLRRAAFALRFADINPLISSQVQGGTRILYLRDIRDRVEKAAPFLRYDDDPYPVILDGRVLWVLDAYTTTDRYPYSQSFRAEGGLDGSHNYVRNSVKATVDAYDGTIRFYVMDPEDPLLRAYRKAFPELFSERDELPDGLEDHLRYPEDLFSLQTEVFASYHVTDSTTFYNRTDLWAVSPDPGSGEVDVTQAVDGVTTTTDEPQEARSTGPRIDPLYLLIRLPDQEAEEFLILRPFVPVSAENQLTNLVSFMVAKSDFEDYGEIEAFVMPADRTVIGPEQANNAINTTTEISEQFTLLGRQGSRVIQGSMQLIPVEESILYIRPVYVQAQSGSRLPSFRFVTVFYAGQAVIDTSLERALQQIFGEAPPPPVSGGEVPDGTPIDDDVLALLGEANETYARAEEALRQGDLGRYAELIEEVGELLARADELAGGATTTTTTAPPPETATTAPPETTAPTEEASGAAVR
ncbi:MAG: UPF0182 family protein [Acidimicrobiia bacterium]|nr:UPF0182 family protein [Acidimicrobiia bacterium]